jgi:hypothetical protein
MIHKDVKRERRDRKINKDFALGSSLRMIPMDAPLGCSINLN